ncbi:hypothetical protein PVAG01_09911 [Phlyctema vagabunda]|uniref:Uncharacterized protein n=1 Tax=Phlyctema vagabunda TaxID=108571 RepID=A0ABR4P4H6_9HELO
MFSRLAREKEERAAAVNVNLSATGSTADQRNAHASRLQDEHGTEKAGNELCGDNAHASQVQDERDAEKAGNERRGDNARVSNQASKCAKSIDPSLTNAPSNESASKPTAMSPLAWPFSELPRLDKAVTNEAIQMLVPWDYDPNADPAPVKD